MANSSPDVVEAGTVLAGRYRVERQLGKGGMGSVYLVEHVHTEQRLALKLLHAAVVSDEVALERFRREARAPAKVDSDHVVKVTDADVAPELGGVPFLVMEWLRGQSLEDLATERGALPAEEVVLYLRQAARALDKAHALGIIHRDLKPENLFLTTREDGTPCLKVLDFGIAKLTQGNEEGRLKATGTGQIFGTPLYMSPEQTKAELDRICPQSDLWALGILAHRLLLGAEPWTASTLTGLIAQIAYEPLPVPSKVGSTLGPGFDAWFAQCCAREPKERFATAGEAIAALARALDLREEAAAPSALASSGRPLLPRPAREDERTAFSATAPAVAPSVSNPGTALARAPKKRNRLALPLFAAVVALSAAVASGLYVSRQRSAAAQARSVASIEAAPSPPAAPAPTPAAPPVAVTPATTASQANEPEAAEKTPLPSHHPASHPPATGAAPSGPGPTKGAHPPAPAPLPPGPPPAPPPQAPPEDPLGTRH